MKIFGDKQGYTLVEMTLGTVVLLVIMSVAFFAFHRGMESWNHIFIQSRMSYEARVAAEKMARELRSSTASHLDLSQQGTLEFKVPAAIDALTGRVSTWSSPIRYQRGGLNGNQLLRIDTATNETTVLANDITAVGFVLNSNPATLTISLSSEKATVSGRLISFDLENTVELRN